MTKVVIGSAIAGSAAANGVQEAQAASWINRSGGGSAWINR